MKKQIISAVLAATLSVSSFAGSADNNTSGNVSKIDCEFQLIQNMIPSTKISKYRKSMVDGFYDVYFDNGQLIYINPYKEMIFMGELYNKSGLSITATSRQSWQDELLKKDLSVTNPKDLLKYAQKSGKTKIGSQNNLAYIVFTDPECPYCHNVEDFLSGYDSDVYINYLPLPFHKNAPEWALQALSSKDFKTANHDARNGKLNVAITDEAKQLLKDMKVLGEKLKIQGTPQTYVIDIEQNKIIDIIKGARIPELKVYLERKIAKD